MELFRDMTVDNGDTIEAITITMSEEDVYPIFADLPKPKQLKSNIDDFKVYEVKGLIKVDHNCHSL